MLVENWPESPAPVEKSAGRKPQERFSAARRPCNLWANARSRRRRGELPNLLAEDDPKVKWQGSRGEGSGGPERSCSSGPARPT